MIIFEPSILKIVNICPKVCLKEFYFLRDFLTHFRGIEFPQKSFWILVWLEI